MRIEPRESRGRSHTVENNGALASTYRDAAIMTDKQDAEKPNDRGNEPQQRFRHSRKLGLMRSLMINMALIVMPLLIYFVVVIQHSSAYTDQRSLRALQEIGTQVDNTIATLENFLNSGELQKLNSGQLSFVPTCNGALEKCLYPVGINELAACSDLENTASHIRLIVGKGRNPQLRMIDCDVVRGEKKKASSKPVVTTFSNMIEDTQALAEIPLIIVASQRGQVYAQLMRSRTKDPNPPAHAEVREEPPVANLREVLAAAQKHAVDELVGKDEGGNSVKPSDGDPPPAKDEKKANDRTAARGSPADRNQPGLPVALDTHIAGTPYRAYVLPYPLTVPMCEGDPVRCTTTIYLIGLRKSGLAAKATASLSPVLLLGVLLALAAACLLWPFLRHALLEPNDAVTWRQVRILCVAFLVLTALGVLAGRASELGHFMHQKMDHAIEKVADEIDAQLKARIDVELDVLDHLDSYATPKPSTKACSSGSPKPIGMLQAPEPYPIVERYFRLDERGVLGKDKDGVLGRNNWIYDALPNKWVLVCKDIDLSGRQYFSLLKDGHSVDWSNGPIVLQRLFNRSDGKKILQLAVANHGADNVFKGISAVNIGTIEVISPVLPLGIRYAIFERSTGTVVFHSDDSRSLVENFYAETEHNPTLSSAAENDVAGGTLFNGRYRGDSTTFFYRPMTYTPWGLAVYYDSSSVSAVMALAVVSALAATVITLLGGLALAHVVLRLARRRHSWLWPQWRLRNAYPTASVYLAVVSICEFQILRHARSDMWQFAVLLTTPLFVLTACFSALSARTREITAQRPRFFRYAPSLVQWSLILHGVLLITWALAAWAAGEYGACLVLVLAFVAWVALVHWSTELPNMNPWRRDLSLWPGRAFPGTRRASYQIRYLLFAVSLALVVSAVPALAIFDRTFEWYTSSALDLARTDTNKQLDARFQKLKEDASLLSRPVDSYAVRALKLGGFGVTLVDPMIFDVDGKSLFGVESPTPCFHPPVAWPLGAWEGKMHWDQKLLERLRQQAMALEASGPAHTVGTIATAQCGVRGTIHELLHAGGASHMAVLWDIVAGLVVLALLMFLLNFSARHVTGISLPWSGRFGRQSAPVPEPAAANGKSAPIVPRHILLLQPNEESLAYARKCAHGDAHREVDVAADSLDKLKSSGSEEAIWLLRRVEIAVLDENRRRALLVLLEALVADPNTRVIAIGDVSPVYRLARPQAYPGPSWPRIDDNERLRWIDLFTHFQKIYSVDDMKAVFEPNDGGAGVERAPDDPRGGDLDELIDRETRALWPCLRPVRDILLDRLHSGADMTDRDVIELVALHGEVHYRKAWEYCTREERLALYHLAQGKLINMSNHRVVEHLLRRGLVVFEPEPRIKSVSLTEFILNAELAGRMEAWAAEAAEGLWQSLRVPIFVVLMLVVAWIAYSSGDAFQAVVALVATSVAVIGQALRLLGMVGVSAPTKDK